MNRKAWNKAFSLLLAIAMVVSVCTGFVKSERTAEAAAAGVSYTTHVQKKRLDELFIKRSDKWNKWTGLTP